MQSKQFKTSYFQRLIRGDYNPFTPSRITINDDFIEHARRNWYLISVDRKTYHFQNVIGIDVDKSLLGANVVILTSGDNKIMIRGFNKRVADKIAMECKSNISKNSNRVNAEAMKNSNQSTTISVADELEKLQKLHQNGEITTEQYDRMKSRLLA